MQAYLQPVTSADNAPCLLFVVQAYLQRVEESVAFVREQGLQGATKVGGGYLGARVWQGT